MSEQVKKVLAGEGISADEFKYMLDHSAILHVNGLNRRYFGWGFHIDNGTIFRMMRLQMVEIGAGEEQVTEDHEACDGKGCRVCGWVGSIIRHLSDTTKQGLDSLA